MNKLVNFVLLSVLLCITSINVFAEINLPSHFSDSMVLQQKMKVPIWGTATPGEQINILFAGQNKKVTAGQDGKWMVYLSPMSASAAGRMMIISGTKKNETVTFNDVLVGEVWLCSGQSNMDFTVAKTEKYYFAGVNNETAEVAAANYPLIRRFTGEWTRKFEPQTEVKGTWKAINPETVKEFSAIGYFFARDLQKEIKVPIGIIVLTFGASTAQS